MNGAERDAIRVRRKSQFQSLFSDRFPVSGQTERRDETREELTPMTCEEQQGPRSQARLQKDDAFSTNVGTSSLRRVDRLPNREGGPRIAERQKDGWTTVFGASPERTQGKNDLINRTNFECSPGDPVSGPLKCSTQALRATTLRGRAKGKRPIMKVPVPNQKKVTRFLSQRATTGPPHTVGQPLWGLLHLYVSRKETT